MHHRTGWGSLHPHPVRWVSYHVFAVLLSSKKMKLYSFFSNKPSLRIFLAYSLLFFFSPLFFFLTEAYPSALDKEKTYFSYLFEALLFVVAGLQGFVGYTFSLYTALFVSSIWIEVLLCYAFWTTTLWGWIKRRYLWGQFLAAFSPVVALYYGLAAYP